MTSTDTQRRTAQEPAGVPSPLLLMTQRTPTCLWNDSADPVELPQSLTFGAVGATCNPVIALTSIKGDLPTWEQRIRDLAGQRPKATEDEIGWTIVAELSTAAARLLEPAFTAHAGRNGRLSIQTDPRFWRDSEALVEQAVTFSQLADNIIVKIPATAAGVVAIEEATYRGVSINATVSFTVPQTLAVAEAVEAGLRRREAEGLDVERMGPVCTIMVGRLDDWMRVAAGKRGVDINAAAFDWAGVAAFKRAYAIYQERGYRTRLLSAAFRNLGHCTELVGGDVVISPPFAWQTKLNAAYSDGRELEPRIDVPVEPGIIEQLSRIPEFRTAYEPDGMTPEQFDSYGATVRTLRQFLAANNELETLVRDVLLPNPDK